MQENPWKSMWVRPRETIRMIIAENPKRSLWILSFIYGLTSLFNGFQSFPLAIRFGMMPILIFSIILAPFWGYAFFSIWSYVIVWVGRFLKGQANFESARAAYAWSSVPLIGNIPLWLLLILFYSDFFFFGAQEKMLMPGAVALLFLILLGKLVFAIWSIVLYLQSLSEVQQFSIMRAIGNVVLASLIMVIGAAILWAVALFTVNISMGPVAWIDGSTPWIVEQIK